MAQDPNYPNDSVDPDDEFKTWSEVEETPVTQTPPTYPAGGGTPPDDAKPSKLSQYILATAIAAVVLALIACGLAIKAKDSSSSDAAIQAKVTKEVANSLAAQQSKDEKASKKDTSSTNQELATDMRKVQKEVSNTNSNLSSATSDFDGYKKKTDGQIDTITSDLKKANTTTSDLTSDLQKANTEIANLNKRIDSLESRLNNR